MNRIASIWDIIAIEQMPPAGLTLPPSTLVILSRGAERYPDNLLRQWNWNYVRANFSFSPPDYSNTMWSWKLAG